MGDKTVSVRVRFEGGDQVKAGLQEVGREGTRALQGIGTVSAQTGAKLQNAGYQVSDFFVQVAGGTAPSRALAQQLPQLLQGFGLIGVAASVLIAALPSLWSLFSAGATDVAALQKELDGVSKAVDAYGTAADLAIEPMDKLIAKYGDLAGAVRDARVQQAELARGDAIRAVNGLIEGTQAKTGNTGTNPAEISEALKALQTARRLYSLQDAGLDASAEMEALSRVKQSVTDISVAIAAMGQEYGLTVEQAAGLAVAMDRVRDSAGQGAAEQVAAASALRDYLVQVYGSADAANEATGGLVERLNAAVTAAADVASATGTIEAALASAAGIDLSGVFSSAFGAADALLGKIGEIVAGAAESVAAFGRAQSARNWIESNSPGGAANLAAQYAQYGAGRSAFDLARREGTSLYTAPVSTVAARRSGGGGGGADPDIARAKALTEGVRTETEKYAIALDEVNRMKAKGLITDETYNRQLEKLEDKLGSMGDLGQKAASAIRSAFDGLFDDPAAALKNLAKQLAMMALYSGLSKSLPGIFGGGGFLDLGVPGFAAGGVHRGGLRIVGENGPELEATGPSMIYPNSALRSMSRGGAGTSVVINNHSGQPVEERRSRGPSGREIVEVMVGKSISSGRQDKSLGSRFGVKPAPVLR